MGKVLRWVGIILLGLTSAFTILGGVGTICVTLDPAEYPGYERIADFQWLYILFIVGMIAIGVMMIRALVQLIRRKPNGYRDTLIALVSAIVVGFIHMAASRSLRDSGSSMPVDPITYTAVITLVVFLIFRIPAIWAKIGYTQAEPGDNETAGGAAAIASGVLVFTIQYMMASTHTMNGGINYADAFHATMTITGWGLVLGGIGLIVAVQVRKRQPANNLAAESSSA